MYKPSPWLTIFIILFHSSSIMYGQEGLPTVNLGEKIRLPIDYRMLAEYEADFWFWHEMPIRPSNEKRIHTIVYRFSNYKQIDSVRLIKRYILELYKYDKVKYAVLIERIAALEKAEVDFYKEMLLGIWQSEPIRITPSDINTDYYNPNEILIVDNNTLHIYNNDTLQRQTNYAMYLPKSDTLLFSTQYIVLELLDTHEKWNLHFVRPGGSVPRHNIVKELFLYFVYPCGCKSSYQEKSFIRQVTAL